jgi:hypothetical protein
MDTDDAIRLSRKTASNGTGKLAAGIKKLD